ncbi:MAG: cob(I)yrinic acid a,c-diamide adenosyltransferase [Gammaproteobacteria bacterium]|jgi:cob(I)alamin adenosyltransferase|nr:cob(I)yrinic acid a,c-diamide adenosyltransferase [Gammaproteobacteria bacterium]MBT7370590.1 cob(I)yrinic acid a,c-diamide adenosyltransferase [Gammaproteobacteria bacterium]
MGKRLSKIYTRTGDGGETGLGDGSRIRKSAPRIEAIGTVDELNSVIGVVVEELIESDKPDLHDIAGFLRSLQHRVFDLGGELSIPGFNIITADHVSAIEENLDTLNEPLPPLENFILPGGSRLIANCHMARAICRRAERTVIALAETEDVNATALEFLNRLSDYLFVLARSCARITGVDEVLWEKG